MGRMTQYIDFMTAEPGVLTREYIADNYSHLELTPEHWKTRREYKLWKSKPEEGTRFTAPDPQGSLF